jgi:hypothetical protein
MLSCTGELGVKLKKETDAKNPQPHGKDGIRATGLVTHDTRELKLLARVPAVIMRLRDAVLLTGGERTTRSLAREFAGSGSLLRKRAVGFEIETSRWQTGGLRSRDDCILIGFLSRQ